MQTKHPLETILEDLIGKLPAKGAIKANVKSDAQAALERWRSTPHQAPDAELTDLRAMKEAVRKALTWGPPTQHEIASMSREMKRIVSESNALEAAQPTNWHRAEAIAPGTGQTLQPAPLLPGTPRMIQAQSVPTSAASVAAGVVQALPVGVVQAQPVKVA